MTPDLTHERVRQRLGVWSLGLLDARESDAIDAHLASCAECRAISESVRRPEHGADAGGQHLPSSLIATWDRSAPKLSGLARDLVRSHLERCDSCRAELEALGYAPQLEWFAPGEEAATPARPERPRILELPRRSRAPIFAWAAGLAAAAAIIVVLSPRVAPLIEMAMKPSVTGKNGSTPPNVSPGANDRGGQLAGPNVTKGDSGHAVTPTRIPVGTEAPLLAHESAPTESSHRETGLPPGVTVEPLQLAFVPETEDAAVLHGVARGAPRQLHPVTPDAAGSLTLQIPEDLDDIPSTARVQIAVMDDAGQTRARLETTMGSMRGKGAQLQRRALVLKPGTETLREGHYTVTFHVLRPGQPATDLAYEFQIAQPRK